MNFRLTAILFGAILVIGVVLLIFTFTGDSDTVSTDALMEELASSSRTRSTSSRSSAKTARRSSSSRTGKDKWDVAWEVTTTSGAKEPIKAKADPIAVNELITTLLKAKPTAHSGT